MISVLNLTGDRSVTFRFWGESFVASLLSSLKTIVLHLQQPLESMLVNLPTNIFASPKDTPTLLRAFAQGAKSYFPQLVTGFTKDIFTFYEDRGTFFHNELNKQWDIAIDEWQKGNYKAAVPRLMFAWQRYVISALQAANQAGMAATQQYKLLLYSSLAARNAGLSTADIGRLVDVVQTAKQFGYEQGIARGLDKMQALNFGDEWAAGALMEHLSSMGVPEVHQVMAAAERDVYSAVGRRAPGVKETGPKSEGFLSRPVNVVLQFASERRRAGGAENILTVSAIGFAQVPWRTMRYYLGNSAYGVLRFGIDKWRQNRGLDTFWKQSYGNTLQAQMRFREAVAGTALMTAFFGWQAYNSTADDKKHAFGLFATGLGPKNRVLRDAWLKQGYQPLSINTVVNGRVVAAMPFTRVGSALSAAMLLPAAWDDVQWLKKEGQATRPGKEIAATREIGTALGTMLEVLSAQGMFQSLSHLSSVLRGEGNPMRAVASQAASTFSAIAMPGKGMLNSLTGIIYGNVDRSSIEAVTMGNFPVLDAFVNGQQINRFGDQIGNNSWYGRLSAYAGLPVVFRVADTPENHQIYELIANKGAAPPAMLRSAVEDKYGALSQTEWQAFAKRAGDALKSETLENIKELQEMTPDEVKKWMNRAGQQSETEAAASMQRFPLKPARGSASEASGGGGRGEAAALPGATAPISPAGRVISEPEAARTGGGGVTRPRRAVYTPFTPRAGAAGRRLGTGRSGHRRLSVGRRLGHPVRLVHGRVGSPRISAGHRRRRRFSVLA